jgi:ubiquitin
VVEDVVSIPGYDAWKLASPPGYDYEPDCPACDDAGCPECCETSPMTEDDLIEITTEEWRERMTDQTLGQSRVRLSFNPSANQDVENIKMRTADLIDLCEDFKKKFNNGEAVRLFALAQTHFEDAAMWAVKGVTST